MFFVIECGADFANSKQYEVLLKVAFTNGTYPILLLALCFLLANCSSEDNTTTESTFAIQVTASSTNVVIDEPFTVTVTANEEMKDIWASLDNFTTGGYANSNFGTSFTLNYNFEKLGTQTNYPCYILLESY
ncbi:hypothetical protein [uncultured Flavobacterium sp.]|uniref:hypothetical protein n=1 Tax=uncultured Flavobacterium sp. TaxID=165435 RepID=UPI0030CA3BD3